MNIPSSVERVPRHTPKQVNEEIRRRTKHAIERYQGASRAQIDRRLEELDREWDIERAMEAHAASMSLLGLTLAGTVNRRWIILPALVSGFLLQHAIQGWCPPVPLFRRLGFRTPQEIEEERYALKLLRGDFEGIARTTGWSGAEDVYRRVVH